MARASISVFNPASSRAFQPRWLVARLIDLPADIEALRISGLRSNRSTSWPLFFRIIASREPTNPANGTRPNLQVDPVSNAFLSHHPWAKNANPTKPTEGPATRLLCYREFFSKPYNNRCKALEGRSHNNHSNSTNREEEFSFKAPPKTSFAALTTHVRYRAT